MTTSNIIFGRNPIYEYLKSNKALGQILFHDQIRRNEWMEKTIKMAKQNCVKYSFVPKNKLNTIAGNVKHQGVVAFVSMVSYCKIEDILNLAKKKKEKPFIVILDSILDPHNLGAIIRTAVAAGVHGVVIPKHGSVSVTDTVVKTSAGTVNKCKIARETNLGQVIEKLKKSDVWIYGADGNSDNNINNTDFRGSVALVLGSESKGLHKNIRSQCDFLIKIPMENQVESLNVSVSAGILIYKAREARLIN